MARQILSCYFDAFLDRRAFRRSETQQIVISIHCKGSPLTVRRFRDESSNVTLLASNMGVGSSLDGFVCLKSTEPLGVRIQDGL